MKVICIDASKGVKTGEMPTFKEGDVLTVMQDPDYPNSYRILEYLYNSSGTFQGWLKKRFVPLSDIDEIELVKQREELIYK